MDGYRLRRLLRACFVTAAISSLALFSTRANSSEPNVAMFDVDGMTLTMLVDDFRRLYPEAEVTERSAARYCYGNIVTIEPLTRLAAVIRQGRATIHIAFDHKHFGHGISTIKRDEVIEFDPSRFASLRERLVRRYGPYTGITYPKKMEPAGLVVGFEWEQKGVASMSINIRRDHTSDSGLFHQTTFLTRSLPGMEGHKIAADYYRGAVQAFRDKCAGR